MSFQFSRQRFAQFERDDAGSATIEFVLWFPLFMMAFLLTFDTTMMFVAETNAIRITQDGNRLASIGRLSGTAETEEYIESKLRSVSPNVNATTTISSLGVIRSVVQIPASDVGTMGGFTAFNDLTLTIAAEHLKEDFN